MEKVFKKEDIEVLIATMNRNSLDFLLPMFSFGSFSNFNVLVINQTQENTFITSNHPNVRVINTLEKGLSRSRNLALKNAKGKIVLIADDDVVFRKDTFDIILEAYNNNAEAASILFRATNLHGNFLRKYPKRIKTNLNQLDLYNVMSIEMTLNKSVVEAVNCIFDESFGLGSVFQMGEESILLHDLKKQNQQIIYCPQTIVSHSDSTTNEKISLEKRYHLLGAVYTRNQSNFMLWMLLKMLFDIKQSKIKWNQIGLTLREARKGRTEFLKMN